MLLLIVQAVSGQDSDPAHMDRHAEKPVPWPGGIIPFDVSALTSDQRETVQKAFNRWLDTGAVLHFIPRTSEVEYVFFTGKTNAGNNSSHIGFQKGARTEINITSFWWRQGEWMPAHELGHVLGFFHEHARWDRDQHLTVHYENIREGRAADYDWIPKTNWLVSTLPYDYKSLMHYRVCWSGRCESQCKDGDGTSPCAVLSPISTNYSRVIGQWGDNGVSALDAAKVRIVYGTNSVSVPTNDRNSGSAR